MIPRRKFNGAKRNTEATGVRCRGTGDRYQETGVRVQEYRYQEGGMNQSSSFEDLDVFQRAYTISLEIHRASLTFPSVEQYGLGHTDQECKQINMREHC